VRMSGRVSDRRSGKASGQQWEILLDYAMDLVLENRSVLQKEQHWENVWDPEMGLGLA